MGKYFGQRSKWKIFCTIMKMKWSCGIYQTVIIPRRMPGKGHWRELKKLWIIISLVKFSYVAFMYW
jgi:hypothetical protein